MLVTWVCIWLISTDVNSAHLPIEGTVSSRAKESKVVMVPVTKKLREYPPIYKYRSRSVINFKNMVAIKLCKIWTEFHRDNRFIKEPSKHTQPRSYTLFTPRIDRYTDRNPHTSHLVKTCSYERSWCVTRCQWPFHCCLCQDKRNIECPLQCLRVEDSTHVFNIK